MGFTKVVLLIVVWVVLLKNVSIGFCYYDKCDICQTVRTGKIVHHNTNIGHLSTYMSSCVLTCCLLCIKIVILILIETHLIKNKIPHHASDSVVELSSIAKKWSPLFFSQVDRCEQAGISVDYTVYR